MYIYQYRKQSNVHFCIMGSTNMSNADLKKWLWKPFIRSSRHTGYLILHCSQFQYAEHV